MEDKSLKKKKKKTKKTIITYIVSILCLLLCLYITIEVLVANNQNRPPKIFNLSVSHVPTESMEPTIKKGSYIMFYGIDGDDVEVGSGTKQENHDNKTGDIIIYYNENEDKFIVHRAVFVGYDDDGRYFIVWGDNNNIEDSYKVRDNMIYGKYLTTLNFLNFLSGGTSTNVVFIIIIVIFVIMIIMQVSQIVLKNKTEKIKKQKEEEKKKLLDEWKKEIIAEEIAKLKEAKENKEISKEEKLLEDNNDNLDINNESTNDDNLESNNEKLDDNNETSSDDSTNL